MQMDFSQMDYYFNKIMEVTRWRKVAMSKRETQKLIKPQKVGDRKGATFIDIKAVKSTKRRWISVGLLLQQDHGSNTLR